MPEQAVTPETGAVKDEASAITKVAGMLEPLEDGSPEAQQPEPSKVTREEPETPAEEAGTSPEDTADPEPEGEGEELPDTLEGLAQALEMDPGDLAGHLKVPVKIKGEIGTVTLSEAIAGYQREADYSRQTMELADQKRGHEAMVQQVNERWQQDFQRLGEAIQTLEEGVEAQSPEALLELMESDPQEYLRVNARQQAQKDRLEKAKQVQGEEFARLQQATAQNMQRYRVEQQRLLTEKIPDASDPVKFAAFENQVKTYLAGAAYTGQEIDGFFGGAFDHRQILIVRDAMRYRAMLDGKKELPKKLQGLGKVMKPGAAQPKKTDTDKIVAGRNRLRQLRAKGSKTQQTDAAVAYVKNLLG